MSGLVQWDKQNKAHGSLIQTQNWHRRVNKGWKAPGLALRRARRVPAACVSDAETCTPVFCSVIS